MFCQYSSPEEDEDHVLHSFLDTTSRIDTEREDCLLVGGFSTVPYLPPLETHYDMVPDYHVIAANIRAELPAAHNLDPNPEYVEVWYSDFMWKTISDVPREPEAGESVVVRLYFHHPANAL